MRVNCLLHVHSSFSYDSQMDLAEIAATARRHGFRVVLMSEHNNYLNSEQVATFVRRCDELSDDQLLMVPGLELAFDSNRVHLLAYGIRTYIDSTGPGCTFQSLVSAVRDAGGLAVLAHPSHKRALERLSSDDFRELDGVEVWNVKNGNRFVPTAADLKLLQRLRASAGRQVGYGGVDWHHLVNFSPLTVSVDTSAVTWPALRQALRAGSFRVRGRFVSVPATGETRARRIVVYRVTAGAITRLRGTAYRWQRRLESRGVKTPRVVASIARRLF